MIASVGRPVKDAVAGAEVVIDVSNVPPSERPAVLEFFENSSRNLVTAEASAAVQHHVTLSIIGADRVPGQQHFRAKVAQEKRVQASGIPYTIIRATQFLEFLGRIADANTEGCVVRLPRGLFQPVAADDVAAFVADVALASPQNRIVEIAGPQRGRFTAVIAHYLNAIGDPRTVVEDPEAEYFGGQIEERSLVPWGAAHVGSLTLDDWLRLEEAGRDQAGIEARRSTGHRT